MVLHELLQYGILSVNNGTLESFVPPTNKQFCNSIRRISLEENAAKEIPDWIKYYDAVEEIGFSSNRLRKLPYFLQRMEQLVLLDLSHNRLDWKTDSLFIPKLRFLDLRKNRLPKIPDCIYFLVKLERLNLDHNNIRLVEPPVENLTSLAELTITHNSLVGLPQQIQKLSGLVNLDIASNPTLRTPPEFIAKNMQLLLLYMKNLAHGQRTEQLVLRDLALEITPGAEMGITSLRTLDLRGNILPELSSWVGSLETLEELWLDGNQLHSMGATLEKMRSLKILSIGHNRFHTLTIPKGIQTTLTALNIAANRFRSLPKETRFLTNLTNFSAQKNPLETLDIWIGTLEKAEITLDFEGIGNIPFEILKTKSIYTLKTYCLQILRCDDWKEGTFTLSGHSLPIVSDVICDLSHLRKLDFSKNKLRTFSPGLVKLTSLTSLNIAYNRLSNIPENFCLNVTCLKELRCDHNIIDYLPSSLRYSAHLEVMDFAYNKVLRLGDYFTKLGNLKSLGIGHNELVEFPACVALCTSLTSLDISHCGIPEFPKELVALTSLMELDLRENKLVSLPLELGAMQSLQIVHVDSNKIEEMPFKMLSTINVRELTFANNPFSRMDVSCPSWTQEQLLYYLRALDRALSSGVADLSGIGLHSISRQMLDIPLHYGHQGFFVEMILDNNNIREIPWELCLQTRLRKLSVIGNPIEYFPPSLATVSSLEEFIFDVEQLSKVCLRPPGFVCLAGAEAMLRYLGALFLGSHTKVLKLSHTNLMAIPADVVDCGLDLVRLFASNNRIDDLPDWIDLFSEIVEMDLSDNKIEHVNQAVRALTNMRILNLSRNKLKVLPDQVEGMGLLEELRIGGNTIQDLPPSILSLTMLQTLDLTHSGIEKFPAICVRLSTLTILDLSHNPIGMLPLELAWLPRLHPMHGLPLDHMNIVSPPPDIIKRGTAEVQRFLDRMAAARDRDPVLDLSNLAVYIYPPELIELVQLQVLNLSQNHMTEIPGIIGVLTKLARLDLSRNMLTSMCAELALLTNLTELDVSYNKIEYLCPGKTLWQFYNLKSIRLNNNNIVLFPSGLDTSTALTELNLGHNKLSNLPNTMRNLSNLELLNLDDNPIDHHAIYTMGLPSMVNLLDLSVCGNALTAVPLGIGRCSNLTRLCMSNNRLTGVNPDLADLCNLILLDFSFNAFRLLPFQFIHFTRLETLLLEGNPLVSPPPDVVAMGAQSVVTFLAREASDLFDKKPLANRVTWNEF